MKIRHILTAAALTASVVLTGCSSSTPGDNKPSHSTKAKPAVEKPAEPVYTDPTADDFLFDVKTVRRQCFGSAGCNVTVSPDITFLGDLDDLDPDKTYQITYTIHGDESGPVIETATLSDRSTLNYPESMLSTANSVTKIHGEVTDVTEMG